MFPIGSSLKELSEYIKLFLRDSQYFQVKKVNKETSKKKPNPKPKQNQTPEKELYKFCFHQQKIIILPH